MPDEPDILRAAGLRRTPARVAVIDRLRGAGRPLSVQDVQAQMPAGSDLVTIYRTLNTLVKKSLVRRVRADDRGWLYELVAAEPTSKQGHGHAHFVCDACGTVECLPEMTVDVAAAGRKLQKGYAVTTQEVTLHGTCPDCHD